MIAVPAGIIPTRVVHVQTSVVLVDVVAVLTHAAVPDAGTGGVAASTVPVEDVNARVRKYASGVVSTN